MVKESAAAAAGCGERAWTGLRRTVIGYRRSAGRLNHLAFIVS
jgi:hypothetical protein